MARKHTGVTLTAAQRKQLTAIMEATPNAELAKSGLSLNTLKSAAGGARVQRGTAALIVAWLQEQGSGQRHSD